MTMPPDPNRATGDRNHDLHDVDLIAAYALDHDGIDRDAARQLVAACPECRAEFINQGEVTAWLSAAPVVALGDDERAAVHARVDRAIAKPTVVELPHRRGRQPGQILFRIGAAAAALAVIAGIGGVFNGVGGDDGGSVFQTEASELAGASSESTSAESTVAAGPTTTTAATFAAASTERTMLSGGDAAAVKLEIEELIARASSPEEAGASDNSQADAMMSGTECSDEIVDREILITAESLLEGEPIVVFVVSGADAGQEVEALVFRIADCSTVDLG